MVDDYLALDESTRVASERIYPWDEFRNILSEATGGGSIGRQDISITWDEIFGSFGMFHQTTTVCTPPEEEIIFPNGTDDIKDLEELA